MGLDAHQRVSTLPHKHTHHTRTHTQVCQSLHSNVAHLSPAISYPVPNMAWRRRLGEGITWIKMEMNARTSKLTWFYSLYILLAHSWRVFFSVRVEQLDAVSAVIVVWFNSFLVQFNLEKWNNEKGWFPIFLSCSSTPEPVSRFTTSPFCVGTQDSNILTHTDTHTLLTRWRRDGSVIACD